MRWVKLGIAITVVALLGAATSLLLREQTPCDRSRLEADAQALADAMDRWSARDGRIPDFVTPAASAVWKACDDMPREFRSYLDFSVVHPRPRWEREGKPAPAHAVSDPLADVLPGHLDLHRRGSLGEGSNSGPDFLPRLEAVCPGFERVAREVASAAASGRTAALFDGCGLSSVGWFDRDEFLAAGTSPRAIRAIALHDWLVEDGISSSAADIVASELLFADSRSREPGWPLFGDGRLPWATRGDRLILHGPLILVTSRDVKVAGWDAEEAEVVARIAADAVPPELMEDETARLREIFESPDHEREFIVFADRETPWGLLRQVQELAERARIAPLPIAVLVDSPRDPLRTIALPDSRAEIPDATPVQDLVVGRP